MKFQRTFIILTVQHSIALHKDEISSLKQAFLVQVHVCPYLTDSTAISENVFCVCLIFHYSQAFQLIFIVHFSSFMSMSACLTAFAIISTS